MMFAANVVPPWTATPPLGTRFYRSISLDDPYVTNYRRRRIATAATAVGLALPYRPSLLPAPPSAFLRAPLSSAMLSTFPGPTFDESQLHLSAVSPPPPPPLFLRIASALGSHVALFLTVPDLVGIYVCAHPCRTFVAHHLKTATDLSFGRLRTSRSTATNDIDVADRNGGRSTTNDCCDDSDGIGTSRGLFLSDGRVDAARHPETFVALGFRLVCAHARRLHTLDCRAIPPPADVWRFERSGSPDEALALLILANRRTLQSVRARPPFLGVVGLVALRECVRLSVVDSADCRDLVDTARGASSATDFREVEFDAITNLFKSAAHLKRVCLVASDFDWGDAPDAAPHSGGSRARLLARSLPPETVTHLTLRPATGTAWIDGGGMSTRLIDLDFQLAQTLFPVFCAVFGERLPTLASLARLRISALDGSSTTLAYVEESEPVVWRSSSLRHLTLCGSAPPVARHMEVVAATDDDDGQVAVTALDPEFGGNTSPVRWPRVVAPRLVEFRGELDLEALTDFVADAPQLEILVCVRARSRRVLMRHVHELLYDYRGRRLMTPEAIERFTETVRRPDAFQHLTILDLRGFPFSAAMLDAVGDACRDRNLERVRLQVAFHADTRVPRFLRRLSASLRDCLLTRAQFADGTEVDASSRDPVPPALVSVATPSSSNPRSELATATGVIGLVKCDVTAEGSSGGGDGNGKMREKCGADIEVTTERLSLPRLVRLRLPRPCWSRQFVTSLDAPLLERLWFAVQPGVPIDRLLRRLTKCRHLTIDLSAMESSRDSSLPCAARDEVSHLPDRNVVSYASSSSSASSSASSSSSARPSDRWRDRGPHSPLVPPLASLRLNGVGTRSLIALASWLPTVTDLEIAFYETLTTTALELVLTHLRLVTATQFPQLAHLRFRNRIFGPRDTTQRHRLLASLGALVVANYRLHSLDLPETADIDTRNKIRDLLQPI